MDFKSVLSMAVKNEANKQGQSPCYQTKYTPAKKQTKQSKILSENIKKFLARKEEEEKQKALEEKRKKENLLALRDQKTQNRINKHLKVCKSANKSVLADAIDNENTSVTIAGRSQPDEDDYGYVSQAASELYDRFMDKYSKEPEESTFSNSEKRTIKDIALTKDRLKQAFKQQELGETTTRRKRKSSASNVKESAETDEKSEKDETSKDKEEDKEEQPKPKKKPLPPPMNFMELLKLAQKKQHEPVVLEAKPKVDEVRPMTKRQLQEYMQEKERKEQREQRERERNLKANKKPSTGISNKSLNKTQLSKNLNIEKPETSNSTSTKIASKIASKVAPTVLKKIIRKPDNDRQSVKKSDSSKNEKNELLEERRKLDAERKQLEQMRRAIEEEKKKLSQNRSGREDVKAQAKSSNDKITTKPKVVDKQTSSKDVKPRQFPPTDLKHSSLPHNKPKQFPPLDVRPAKSKLAIKPVMKSNKRRIYDDEEEHDPEMDDFIDDEVEEENADYSKYISEIFGYDKNRYRQIDDEDDTYMESNFAQQLKEEYISTKIGIMEDLEDMQMEELEKKRKILLKKKLKK